MLLSISFGFLIGVVAVLGIEAAALLLIVNRLRGRRPESRTTGSPECRGIEQDSSLLASRNKKGFVWILEEEKVPHIEANESPTKVTKDQRNKKEAVQVFPIKKYAKIRDHLLILFDPDGPQSEIDLWNCSILTISASDLPTRKWVKKYPIKLESKSSVLYNGNKVCYLYFETSWEKESWCKALRFSSCLDNEKVSWCNQLNEQFHQYVMSLSAEYRTFLKPVPLNSDVSEKASKLDGNSSKVRVFLKKLAKKTSKNSVDCKAAGSLSSSIHEKKLGEKIHDTSSTSGSLKADSVEKSSSHSIQDIVKPFPLNQLRGRSQPLLVSESRVDDKPSGDDGTLCLNFLLFRLFFDAKNNMEICNFVKARIQKTLSNLRTPSYIGGVTLNTLDLGNLPPYIHNAKALPMDLNEGWAMEVDIDYSGGIVLDIETRLDVCEPELQKGIMNATSETGSTSETASDLLAGIEYYGNHLRISGELGDHEVNKDGGDKIDELKQPKSGNRISPYMSRWKAIVQSFAEQVSQVPISLAMRVVSLRGTLRLQMKAPPSDQLWFGFTTMPDIEWILESSIGDRKITNSHVASLVGNRIKTAIRETLVLPNWDCLCIPWMLAEKDDWIPRKAAPYMWIHHETTDTTGTNGPNGQPGVDVADLGGGSESKPHTTLSPSSSIGKKKDPEQVEESSKEPNHEFSAHPDQLVSEGCNSESLHNPTDELRMPLLENGERQQSCSKVTVERSDTTPRALATLENYTTIPLEDLKSKKLGSRRAKMMDIGRKMGEKIEEKRRHLEEKSKHIVEKMRENSRT